jgi:hypothetical protein
MFQLAMVPENDLKAHVALIGLMLFAACGAVEDPALPDTAPFHYNGQVLSFPAGTVDGRIEEGAGEQGSWARLMPDRPTSRGAASERFYIDIGRNDTDEQSVDGYRLGGARFPLGSSRVAIGDKYVMLCPPPGMQDYAFRCAVLLRSLPRAAILFRNEPPSLHAARVMVAQLRLI